MDYFKSLAINDLVELITSTKKNLFICLPSMHSEMVDAIADLKHQENFDDDERHVSVIIDFDAQTFRQGYGDFDAVSKLMNLDVDVKNLKDNRISFIISDCEGYYVFVESRSLIPADKETINAVRIDPVSIVQLKKYFFAENTNNLDLKDELANAIIEESKKLENAEGLLQSNQANTVPIKEVEKKEVEDDIRSNPPLNPDYKRVVDTYSHNFQYVKLRFDGANIKSRKINIPSKALPIKDHNFLNRLETKLNLFNAEKDLEQFEEIENVKADVERVRKKYLHKVKSREESILKGTNKESFKEEISALERMLTKNRQKTINQIDSRILETKEDLLIDLESFFNENPDQTSGNANLFGKDAEFIKRKSKDDATRIIFNIKWPTADELLGKMKIITHFSDITFEDLQNEEFIQEMFDNDLIEEKDKNELADFGKSIKIKPN